MNQVRNAPINVQGVVTYDAVVRIDNKELLLKPGMTANVQFLVAQKEDVLALPNVAMRFRPPEEKNEAQELLRQEQGRVGGRIAQRRTSRGGGSGVVGGEGKTRAASESLPPQRRPSRSLSRSSSALPTGPRPKLSTASMRMIR